MKRFLRLFISLVLSFLLFSLPVIASEENLFYVADEDIAGISDDVNVETEYGKSRTKETMHEQIVEENEIENQSSSLPSEEEIQEYVLYFMRTSQEDLSINIKEFIPLYGFEDQLTGYYVTFRNVMGLKGYVLLSFISGENPIVEFSFESDGKIGEYWEENKNDDSVLMQGKGIPEKRIIFTGPESFYVPQGEGVYYSITEDKIVSDVDPQISVCSTAADPPGVIDWSKANLDTSTVYKIPAFGAGSDYWIRSDFDSNSTSAVCCAVAATNILWYWGNQIGRTSIVNKMGGGSNYSKALKLFGLLKNGYWELDPEPVTQDKVLEGYYAVLGSCDQYDSAGKRYSVWNFKNVEGKGGFETFDKVIKEMCPIHVSLVPRFYGRHEVFCLGSAKSNSGVGYLFVMDGEHRSGKFVIFNNTYYDMGASSGKKIYVH